MSALVWTSRPSFRQTCLTLSTVLAAGTAVATVRVLWQRRRKRGQVGDFTGDFFGRRNSHSSKAISWDEIQRHSQADNAWIILDTEVYDVTSWLEDHPGGKLLLLAFAGRDASEPFKTVGHSAIAQRELKRLHVGPVSNAAAPPAFRPHQAGRRATLTGGDKGVLPRAITQEHVLRTADDAVWDVTDHGFLPSSDPVGVEALMGTAFEVFADLADLLPTLGLTGALRRKLNNDLEMQARLRACGEQEAIEGLTTAQLERAFSVAGYTMLAYWRGGTLAYSTGISGSRNPAAVSGGSCGLTAAEHLPDFLSKPMLALSAKIGRPPMPDYATTVLYNWVRIDPDKPVSPSNIRCALRLTGLIDEEWFFKTHVVIESEAVHAVTAVNGALAAEDDSEELLRNLVALEEALWRVVRACLPIMYERGEDGVPKCSADVFYQILRPLIKSGTLIFGGEGDNPISQNLSGPSGAMSSLLPAIDAALGIKMSSDKLRDVLLSFETSMPQEHRAYLADLRSRPSIRQRILLSRPVAGEFSSQHDTLVRSFNRVISRVLDFRWQHWQYVKNFIMKPGNISHAVGSGGTTFDYLQQHITDTENARLTERADGFSKIASPAPADWPSFKLPPVAYHPSKEFWSVDGARGFLSREPLTGPESAWAANLSLEVRDAMKTLWGIAERIPALVASDGPFVKHIEAASDKLAPLQDAGFLFSLSEVAREHLMTTLSHIAAGCIGVQRDKPLPRCIDRPWKAVARSVGRPPHMDFTEMVLSNWTVTSAHEEKAADQHDSEVGSGDDAPPTIHVVWRFLASPDEEWYRAIHILLHEESREIVTAIRIGQVAMSDQNDLGVVGSIVKLGLWMNKFCDIFDAYFEQKDSRTEAVTMRRLEPFTSHSPGRNMTWEETACWVYCSGSSPILPALHAFLGVEMWHVAERDEHGEADRIVASCQQLMKEWRMCMPRLHRAFLEELEKPGHSLRQYCFRRFGAKAVSVESLHDLEVAYNDTLNALLRFLSRRGHLVNRLFPQLASGFGAMQQELEGAMRRNRLQLLKMRQRVDRCWEKLP